MKRTIIGVGVGSVAFFLLFKYAIKTSDEDPGLVRFSDGFGLDDLILGGGSYLAGALAADMIAKRV